MNKRILIGLIISITILLLTPILPIVQFSSAEEANEKRLIKEVGTLFGQDLLKDIDIYDGDEQRYFIEVLSQLCEHVSIKDLLTTTTENNEDDPQALFFPFLGIFIYGFIAFVILKIIVIIFQYFGSIIRSIVNNIADRINNLIQFILDIITFILHLILTIIQGIFSLTLKTGELIITLVATILSAILSVILFIINVIGSILMRIWQGIGTFMGLMLEILLLIYETIFPSVNAIL